MRWFAVVPVVGAGFPADWGENVSDVMPATQHGVMAASYSSDLFLMTARTASARQERRPGKPLSRGPFAGNVAGRGEKCLFRAEPDWNRSHGIFTADRH